MIRGNAAMTFARLIARARRPVRQLLRDKRGISAVEFAMLLPLMVTLYLGGVEVSQAVAVDRQGDPVAPPLRGLVGPATKISNLDSRNNPAPPPAVVVPHFNSQLE